MPDEKMEFYVKSSTSANQMLLGLVATIIGVIGLVVAPPLAMALPIGIIYFILGVLHKNPIVKLCDSHFELKAASAAALKLICYSDIEFIVDEAQNKVAVHTRSMGKVYLPLRMMEPQDGCALRAALQARVTQPALP